MVWSEVILWKLLENTHWTTSHGFFYVSDGIYKSIVQNIDQWYQKKCNSNECCKELCLWKISECCYKLCNCQSQVSIGESVSNNNTFTSKEFVIVELKDMITKKYHVFAPMGRFQLESIYLYFPPSSQLLYWCFYPVGLSLL